MLRLSFYSHRDNHFHKMFSPQMMQVLGGGGTSVDAGKTGFYSDIEAVQQKEKDDTCEVNKASVL